ncbi:glycosyltransferase family 39 protein [Allonocardiopsis opalescens]|uniref:4-amino-4-deoxy-L-arabinose transferase-like glycosyltransferase n=1 Tax=Allonocardiopsis opalescens TaxID=1144618 RepID=A0A2T0Q1T0_9ACTN|nr:glycosyltransferase family 39 protein [Allonocardiopsis opalescens]PRX97731.1 4-amino-4-deoxy-L-arabinose transferase-like glycosyltransferase [Allonocardiopsis opalescens]
MTAVTTARAPGRDPGGPAGPAAPPARPWYLRALLGGPADPVWARPALLAILLGAALLYLWDLPGNEDSNRYYAAAVLGMATDWTAFFFGSFDAASFITVDKPPLALWVQALSVRIFGYSSWSILVPQALAGLAAIAVVHRVVRRDFGFAAATLAAAALAVTPIAVAMAQHNNPDGLLTLLLVLSGWAALAATRTGRLGPVLWCAVAVGLAFNVKMLQAFLVVPVFALVYLVAAPRPLRVRIGHLLGAGAVLSAVSFAWITVVDLIPASARPYVGGSPANSAWELVLGYNGLGRVFGREDGAQGPQGGVVYTYGPPGAGAGASGGGPELETMGFGGDPGWDRLFNAQVGGQIAWLLPFAALAVAVAVALAGRRPRTDGRRAQALMWGGWLLVHYAVFSFAQGIWHTYYTVALAPAVAALAGIGAVGLARLYRTSRWWGWLPAAAVAGSGALAVVLLRRTPEFVPWLAPAVGAAAGAGALVLLLGWALRRSGPYWSRAAAVAAGVSALALLAGPAAYAAHTLSTPITGTDPTAGPAAQGAGPTNTAQPPPGASGTAPPPGGGLRTAGGGGMDVDPELLDYLLAQHDGETWLAATVGSDEAASIILETGMPAMAMGGFSGGGNAPTAERLAEYVAGGELRFVLASPEGGRPGGADVLEWVGANCAPVDPSAYGGEPVPEAGGQGQGGGPRLMGPGPSTLYDCAA